MIVKKRKTEQTERDILSFFEEEETMPKSEKAVRIKAKMKGEDEILEFIRSKGKVAKSELYKWAKKHDIRPAELYGILRKLQKDKLIKTFFDEDLQELSYKIF